MEMNENGITLKIDGDEWKWNSLALKIDGDEFTSVISPKSISNGATNYVDILNSLTVRIDDNVINDVDEFVNIAKVLYNSIVFRNTQSSGHGITKTLHNIFTKLYAIASDHGLKIYKPIKLNHIAINNSGCQLNINASVPDEVYDSTFNLKIKTIPKTIWNIFLMH